MYRATVDAATFQELSQGGYDIASVEPTRKGIRVALVLTAAERDRLRREGVALKVWRDKRGRTQSQRFALQQANGFEVFRPYDGPNGIEAEIRRVARRFPQIAQLHVLGQTHEGRDILAIRMTQGVRDVPLHSRPAILYQATTHAREWISTEVARRLMWWYINRFPNNKTVHNILKNTELWFVLVVNPDGYQFTFDEERLWRKNLRDNNEDGDITAGDGVDVNRNYPEHWNYDEEGSSSQLSSETYRGPAPASEPETQADMSIYDMADLKFAISYHSFGQLLLYTQGWQFNTPSADDPIYVALTGTDDDPAIEGFNPGVGADLYITNGEYTDWSHAEEGVLAWTPELSEGCDGCGFVFPDNEALVQEEFEKNLQFAVNVARSAHDPDDPVSHAGIDTANFYLDIGQIDPWKNHNPSSDLAVDVSYAGGSAQPVDVLAKRSLGAVQLHYKVNGVEGAPVPTTEVPDGEVFGGNNAYNAYYHYLRGEIPGLSFGDDVEYWFTGSGAASAHTTFEVVEDADADVLIVSAEDYTGASPPQDPDGPHYLSFYEDALNANGTAFDVYDVDAMGRQAPDHLGVLSHYDAVIWYTGDDVVTREPGWSAGNVSRLAVDMTLEMRAYLNEGGKVLYTGQFAGAIENGVGGNQFYDPVANERCVVGGVLVLDRCLLWADKNDFIQYYLGAFIYNSDGGTDPETGELFPVEGVSDPYTEMGWEFNGEDSAQNQGHSASFLTTSSILKPDTYPQFESHAPAVWVTEAAGGFEPFDGDFYMYSQRADVSFKRLMRTISVPSGGATLTFRVSYDTEQDWDFVFVEAHTVGQDDWTTLPDANGHTGNDTGESCPAGWFELHPWIERYQGSDCSGANAATGGEWNAHSGRSAGWEEWEIDLSDYAGSQVELSISYASDWGIQGLGAFVDQIEVSTGEGSTSFEEDGDPMDGWTVPGPPEGSDANANDWIRSESVGFEEGAVVSTDDTLYFGFGFEGITDEDTRAAVMDQSIGYLIP
ncbi:MAG TPA: M14 family zinc carboxypeptidase [Actinomycetota bacterium]|nr:M14 family zinc carboxypeptidase [Actinomycetota bacterium]